MLASLIAGILWESISSAAPFLLGGTMAILASIAFIGLEKKINHISLFASTQP